MTPAPVFFVKIALYTFHVKTLRIVAI